MNTFDRSEGFAIVPFLLRAALTLKHSRASGFEIVQTVTVYELNANNYNQNTFIIKHIKNSHCNLNSKTQVRLLYHYKVEKWRLGG